MSGILRQSDKLLDTDELWQHGIECWTHKMWQYAFASPAADPELCQLPEDKATPPQGVRLGIGRLYLAVQLHYAFQVHLQRTPTSDIIEEASKRSHELHIAR